MNKENIIGELTFKECRLICLSQSIIKSSQAERVYSHESRCIRMLLNFALIALDIYYAPMLKYSLDVLFQCFVYVHKFILIKTINHQCTDLIMLNTHGVQWFFKIVITINLNYSG